MPTFICKYCDSSFIVTKRFCHLVSYVAIRVLMALTMKLSLPWRWRWQSIITLLEDSQAKVSRFFLHLSHRVTCMHLPYSKIHQYSCAVVTRIPLSHVRNKRIKFILIVKGEEGCVKWTEEAGSLRDPDERVLFRLRNVNIVKKPTIVTLCRRNEPPHLDLTHATGCKHPRLSLRET
jgi:hypothetical protein